MIIDISSWQDPAKINYDELAKQVKLAIIRTQYGSRHLDKHYKTHHTEFKKRGIPTAAYAWIRGINTADMKVEATDFYNRTKEFNPTIWFLDVEEQTMPNMRAGTSAYVDQLRKLGAKKIGIYVGHHLYKQFNLNLDEVDAVWIPHYGKNDGTLNSKPSFACDIHQYTDKGKLDGYNGNLDLNTLTGSKPLSFFTGEEKQEVREEVKLDTIKIKLHDKEIEVEGIFRDGTNYVPVRLLEQLGYDLDWRNNTVIIKYRKQVQDENK